MSGRMTDCMRDLDVQTAVLEIPSRLAGAGIMDVAELLY